MKDPITSTFAAVSATVVSGHAADPAAVWDLEELSGGLATDSVTANGCDIEKVQFLTETVPDPRHLHPHILPGATRALRAEAP